MEQATENSRRQHVELRRLSDELLSVVESPPPLDERAAQRVLSRLVGVLKVHVAMEIDGLYPPLLQHEQNEVRSMASEMVRRLRATYDGFLEFRLTWTPEAVRADPASFAKRAQALVTNLHKATQNEESDLYNKVDAIYAAMRR